jgi:hypothetical protein
VNPPSNPFDATWLVVDNPTVSGELITLTAGATKYALVFTDTDLAAGFLRGMNDPSLQIVSFESWVMKEAFLSAAKILGATRIMFDYARGQHNAQSAPLEGLTEFIKSRIGV